MACHQLDPISNDRLTRSCGIIDGVPNMTADIGKRAAPACSAEYPNCPGLLRHIQESAIPVVVVPSYLFLFLVLSGLPCPPAIPVKIAPAV